MIDRTRISITLRPEIVQLLDTKVDGVKLRNRSHAIEQILKMYLVSPVKQAVLLIGDEEKAMMKFGKFTMIEHLIRKLHRAEVKKVVIAMQAKSMKLENFLSKKFGEKIEIKYCYNEVKGTAAAVYAAKSKLAPEDFIVIYGDVLADIDILDIVDFHRSHEGLATMMVTSVPDPLPWGVVRLKRDKIISFQEKSAEHARLTNLINGGLFVFGTEIFSYLNENSVSLEREVFPLLAQEYRLYGYLLDGVWYDIGVSELAEKASKLYRG